jgi:hypothetical protein
MHASKLATMIAILSTAAGFAAPAGTARAQISGTIGGDFVAPRHSKYPRGGGEDDRLASEVRELDGLALLVGEFEVGSFGALLEHASEPTRAMDRRSRCRYSEAQGRPTRIRQPTDLRGSSPSSPASRSLQPYATRSRIVWRACARAPARPRRAWTRSSREDAPGRGSTRVQRRRSSATTIEGSQGDRCRHVGTHRGGARRARRRTLPLCHAIRRRDDLRGIAHGGDHRRRSPARPRCRQGSRAAGGGRRRPPG